jgi:hypothetical protein
VKPNLPGLLPSSTGRGLGPFPSVRVQDVAIVELQRRILSLLLERIVADDQHLDFGAHKDSGTRPPACRRALGERS